MAMGSRRGIPLRALPPNAITILALCSGLSAIRFAIGQEWDRAVLAIIVAGALDGVDGRIARLLKADSRFGAELDSLSDVSAFGVAPALVTYLWALHMVPRYGWICALGLAVCCALRLARFNAQIDGKDLPQKSAGFLTGVPAPVGALLALLPMYLWLWTENALFRSPLVVGPWVLMIGFLMISDIATFSWSSLRLRRSLRLGALALIALTGAALVSAPWVTLSVGALVYLITIPFSIRNYAAVRRRRRASAAPVPMAQTPATVQTSATQTSAIQPPEMQKSPESAPGK